MKALDRKLWRDLWHMRGQALAIALVLAAATSTFVLSFGVQQSLIQTRVFDGGRLQARGAQARAMADAGGGPARRESRLR